MDQYRKALIDDLDYDKFLDLVWQLYQRTEEVYEPYWQKYNYWHVYPDGHRWIRSHITGFFWQNGQPGSNSDSFTNEGATGWTPRANTRVQPSHHISKEIRYGKQSRIDCPF